MAVLSWARLTVAAVPFKRWRDSLGPGPESERRDARSSSKGRANEARRDAALVEHAATRLPFATKCLPRAMALSWILRRRRIGHALVFAVRPAQQRPSADALHAWVEIGGAKLIGDLPGPWVETLRLGR